MIHTNQFYYHWLDSHASGVNDYLDKFSDAWSRGGHWGDASTPKEGTVRFYFEVDPYLAYQVVQDWINNKRDAQTNVNELVNYIAEDGVNIFLVLGMPNSGKTTTIWKLCEILHHRYPKYRIVYVSPLRPLELPDWVTWKSDVWKLKEGDVAIVDEASVKDNARRSGSKKNVDDTSWLNIIRHTGCKIFYITQISAMADLNLTRTSNILISKGYGTSAVGMSEIERKHLAENPILQYLKPTTNYAGVLSEERDWAVITLKGKTMMAYLPKPLFMSNQLSKTYSRFINMLMTPTLKASLDAIKDEDERERAEMRLVEPIAMNAAVQMRVDGQYAQTIRDELAARGYIRPLQYWKEFTGEAKVRGGYDDRD